MGLVFFVPAVTTPNNDQSQKGDFYKKQVQVLTFTSVLLRVLQTRISKYLSEVWACYSHMTIYKTQRLV